MIWRDLNKFREQAVWLTKSTPGGKSSEYEGPEAETQLVSLRSRKDASAPGALSEYRTR